MSPALLEGMQLVPLETKTADGGDIMHVMKAQDPGFNGFGEVYVSRVHKGFVKGWKRHRRMRLNLVVPSGKVVFAVSDARRVAQVTLSPANYQRLVVEPGLWVAFKGLGENNLVLNVADLAHDPAEQDSRPLNDISFDWDDL